MSAEATGWVWKHSPYSGAQLLVHLAIADVVNDVNENQFWMSTSALASKAKVSRNTVTTMLSDLVARGLLEMVESGAASRRPSVFRFLMPASALTALAPFGDNSAASATTARDMRGQRASTSAISDGSLARSPRANPREITQEPKGSPSSSRMRIWSAPTVDCIRCRGEGQIWSAGAGVFVPCPCTDAVPVISIPIKGAQP